jgi:hypothetical protein
VEDDYLNVYFIDGSNDVAALVKSTKTGYFARVSGMWMKIASSWLREDDKSSFEIDPKRAKDFIDLYDKRKLTIEDIDEYERENIWD